MTEIDAMDFWMKQLSNKSSETRRIYTYYFKDFAKWMKNTPNDLVEMKKHSLEHKGDRRENMVLETAVKQYMEEVKDKYAFSSQKMIFTAIISFFDLNQYPLQMKRGDRPSGDVIGSRIPEKKEVVTLINAAKSKPKRAVILLLKDTGLRLSDAVRLKWGEIQDYGEGFWGWKIITQKRKIKALPFAGPETTQALSQLERKTDRIFPITAKNLSNQLSLLIRESGLEKGLTPHGLRKYFNVELQAARVPKEWRHIMMGKKSGAYDENRHRKLFQAYKESYNQLRIYGGLISSQDLEEIVERRVRERLELERERLLRQLKAEVREEARAEVRAWFGIPEVATKEEKNLKATLKKLMEQSPFKP